MGQLVKVKGHGWHGSPFSLLPYHFRLYWSCECWRSTSKLCCIPAHAQPWDVFSSRGDPVACWWAAGRSLLEPDKASTDFLPVIWDKRQTARRDKMALAVSAERRHWWQICFLCQIFRFSYGPKLSVVWRWEVYCAPCWESITPVINEYWSILGAKHNLTQTLAIWGGRLSFF